MRSFSVLGDLPHDNPVAPAIFPQQLIPGFFQVPFHLGDGRRIHHHGSLPF